MSGASGRGYCCTFTTEIVARGFTIMPPVWKEELYPIKIPN